MNISSPPLSKTLRSPTSQEHPFSERTHFQGKIYHDPLKFSHMADSSPLFFIQILQKQGVLGGSLYEFKVSLINIGSSRTARPVTQRNCALKSQKVREEMMVAQQCACAQCHKLCASRQLGWHIVCYTFFFFNRLRSNMIMLALWLSSSLNSRGSYSWGTLARI